MNLTVKSLFKYFLDIYVNIKTTKIITNTTYII